MNSPLLELDLLSTLVAIADLGGFSKAGARVGRTQSAVSLQMRRLEEATGLKLFSRQGRRQGLTEAGHALVHYGRRMLALNEEALGMLAGASLAGTVRLGASPDLAESWLPPVLGEFAGQFPAVRLECIMDRSAHLVQLAKDGRLDLAVTFDQGEYATARVLGQIPLVWIGSRRLPAKRRGSLALAVLSAPSPFRERAEAALDRAGIPWRVVFTSLSVAAVWAAVRAGLGVTVRPSIGIPPDLTRVPRAWRLPPAGNAQLSLHAAPGGLSSAGVRLSDMLEKHLRGRLKAARKTG